MTQHVFRPYHHLYRGVIRCIYNIYSTTLTIVRWNILNLGYAIMVQWGRVLCMGLVYVVCIWITIKWTQRWYARQWWKSLRHENRMYRIEDHWSMDRWMHRRQMSMSRDRILGHRFQCYLVSRDAYGEERYFGCHFVGLGYFWRDFRKFHIFSRIFEHFTFFPEFSNISHFFDYPRLQMLTLARILTQQFSMHLWNWTLKRLQYQNLAL